MDRQTDKHLLFKQSEITLIKDLRDHSSYKLVGKGKSCWYGILWVDKGWYWLVWADMGWYWLVWVGMGWYGLV